jgi:hypothetical protein
MLADNTVATVARFIQNFQASSVPACSQYLLPSGHRLKATFLTLPQWQISAKDTGIGHWPSAIGQRILDIGADNSGFWIHSKTVTQRYCMFTLWSW